MSGNWIGLTSGGGYDFEDCRLFGPFTMERDLAHPLANLPRYVSHTSQKISVAAHSIAVAATLETMGFERHVVAAGLLHDAHEAVIGDIPTPVARYIGYDSLKRLKSEVQIAIHLRLEIPSDIDPEGEEAKRPIDLADAAALIVEKRMFMLPEPRGWSVTPPPYEWSQAYHNAMQGIIDAGSMFGDRARVHFDQEYRRLVLV